MDSYNFNGEQFTVRTQTDFANMFRKVLGVNDELINQFEAAKVEIGLQGQALQFYRTQFSTMGSAGNGAPMAAALAAAAGRSRRALSATPIPTPTPLPAPLPQAALANVGPYSGSVSYAPGSLVSYNGLLWQWQGATASPAGTSPLLSASWAALASVPESTAQGWTYIDITSPALVAAAAIAATTYTQQITAGSALAAIPALAVPPNTSAPLMGHLDVEVSAVQNAPGYSLPADQIVQVRPLVSWSPTSGAWTITPYWHGVCPTANTAIAALAANTLRATLRYRQRA